MVGDSPTDIATAQAAGIPVIAVDFGYTNIPVSQLAPDRIISHFNVLADSVTELLALRDSSARPLPGACRGAPEGTRNCHIGGPVKILRVREIRAVR